MGKLSVKPKTTRPNLYTAAGGSPGLVVIGGDS